MGQDSKEYEHAKEMALAAGASGDYFSARTFRHYCVAVNSKTKECIVLGWYDDEIKRNHPEEALRISKDIWRRFLRVPHED